MTHISLTCLNKVKQQFTAWLHQMGCTIAPQYSGSVERTGEDKSQWLVCKVVERTVAGTNVYGIVGVFGDWGKGSHQGAKVFKTPGFESEQSVFDSLDGKERDTLYKQAAANALYTLTSSPNTEPHSPYLERKRISPAEAAMYGAKQGEAHSILLPIHDTWGIVQSLQTIWASGEKQFFAGGKLEAGFLWLIKPKLGRDLDSPQYAGIVYISEGWATGVSVARAAKHLSQSPEFAVACSFGSGNLYKTAKTIQERFTKAKLIICADNDEKTALTHENVGAEAAFHCAKFLNCDYVIPRPIDQSAEMKNYDFWDLEQELGETKLAKYLRDKQKSGTSLLNYFFPKIDGDKISASNKPDYESLLSQLERSHPYSWYGESDQFFVWDKTHYQSHNCKHFIHSWIESHTGTSWGSKHKSEFVHFIECNNRINQEVWDEFDSGKINFQNGVLQLEGLQFTKAEDLEPKDRLFQYCLPFDYDPEAQAPVFEQYLANVSPNPKVAKVLLQWLGAIVCGEPFNGETAKVLLMVGVGANGKSTFINIVSELLGSSVRGSVATLSLSGLADVRFVGDLVGKKVNVIEEGAGFHDSAAWEMLKGLSAGALVTASPKYQNSFSFRNRTKFVIAANDMPKGATVNQGIMRRLCIVPFERRFNGEDAALSIANLDQKLRGELPGIFNAAVLGWKLWLQADKRFEVVSEEVRRDFIEANDSIVSWCESQPFELLPNAVALASIWKDEIRLPAITSIEFDKTPEEYSEKIKELRGVLGLGIAETVPAITGVLANSHMEGADSLFERYQGWAKRNGYKAVNFRTFLKQLVNHYPVLAKLRRKVDVKDVGKMTAFLCVKAVGSGIQISREI